MDNVKETFHKEDTSREHDVRQEKAQKLLKAGINPWPTLPSLENTCQQILDEFSPDNEKKYTVAGRIMSVRLHGKTAFTTIQDRTGRIQIYIRKDAVGEEAFEFFQDFIDLGDFIHISGTTFKTRTGEITIKAETLKLASKCLHPLPEKFHGLSDTETIYRKRYLDLIANQDSRERFSKRSKTIQSMRTYLDNNGFIEVETPMLHPIPGGAIARPFVTHHNALDMELYLRIAPELYLKKLVIGGLERVYEIGRTFRNEGLSTRHNPEFTIAEFYIAHKDYIFMMQLIEEMIRFIAERVNGSLQFAYGDLEIDLSNPFERLTMKDSVKRYAQLTDADLESKTIDKTLKKYNIELSSDEPYGIKLAALFEELVEAKLIQPTFITGYPIEVSPLAKRDPENPNVAARFEIFVAGRELGNGYNELNDPFDQAQRFKDQATRKAKGDEESHYYDADYVHALEHALPPTTGAGIGIDRLVMLLTNAQSIRDVILFPTMKKKD